MYAISTKYSNAALDNIFKFPSFRKTDLTYAPGQIFVRTKSGMLCKDDGEFDGPKVEVIVKPISKDMYVVATKNKTANIAIGLKRYEILRDVKANDTYE